MIGWNVRIWEQSSPNAVDLAHRCEGRVQANQLYSKGLAIWAVAGTEISMSEDSKNKKLRCVERLAAKQANSSEGTSGTTPSPAQHTAGFLCLRAKHSLALRVPAGKSVESPTGPHILLPLAALTGCRGAGVPNGPSCCVRRSTRLGEATWGPMGAQQTDDR